MTKTGSIRGSVVLSRLAFVRQAKGEEAVKRVLAALPLEDRKHFAGTVLPNVWYPFEAGEHLDAAIAAELGGGDEIFKQMGARSAEFNLGDTQKLFVQGRDPQGLLRSASAIYRLYYDTGARTYHASGARKAVLRTLQSKTFSTYDCLTVVGWHEKAIEMCGGRNPRVTHTKCRARGDDFCEYICEWG